MYEKARGEKHKTKRQNTTVVKGSWKGGEGTAKTNRE